MFLYTVHSLETPFCNPVLGQFLDKELALKAADEALPHCVGPVIVEEWPITENSSIVAPSKDKYIAGVECKRIYHKQGERRLSASQQNAHMAQFN